ncbi:hypothetical protein AAHE18_13G121600 [Arachis hypogaea]
MAISGEVSSELEAPLVADTDNTVNGAVDYKGRPSIRSKSGSWRSARFIIGVEVAERVAFYGIEANLISYLTGPLKQSTAAAAENVNIWSGASSLLPLFGAFIADSYLGRYRTIILASIIYILGLGLLTLSALLPSLINSECQVGSKLGSCSTESQVILFFISLYLVAIGQGCMGTLWILNYIQDNLSWVVGFGIPCAVMIIALLVFYLGTWTYRFNIKGHGKSPFVRIGRVFITAARNRQATAIQEETGGTLPPKSSQQFNFLNKALIAPDCSTKEGEVTCSVVEVEEAKAVLRLVPIWATTLPFAIVFAQSPTFFTKQGFTLDRNIFPGFDIPAASLQTLITLAIIVISPIYDRIFVPIARGITGRPSGITMLQRIGIGIFISIFTVIIAALVEMKRLQTAQEFGLVDEPDVTIPMSMWWLIPQYFLLGAAQVFTMVGLQEFFYDQVPNELRSMGLALYLSIFGVGSFLSSFLISVIEEVTGRDGHESWFANNLNKAHLDYFYWLLAALSVIGFSLFICFAKSYIYNHKGISRG